MSRPTPGFYDMVMDSAQLNATPDGKEFVEGFVRIIEDGEHDGKRVKVKGMFLHTPGCLEVTTKQLKIAGWTGEYEPMSFDGRTFRGRVSEETDFKTGQVRYDDKGAAYVCVDGFWDKGSGGGGLREASIDPGRKAQMGERMKAMLQSMSAQEQAAAPPPAQPAQGGGGGWTPPATTPFTPPQTKATPRCAGCGGQMTETMSGALYCRACDDIPF